MAPVMRQLPEPARMSNRDDQVKRSRQPSPSSPSSPSAATPTLGSPPGSILQPGERPPRREPPLPGGRSARDLSTVALIKEITTEVANLAKKQIELATTELKADLRAEATVLGGLGVAALAAVTTLNLLLVTVVLALARVMPGMRGWLAGLLVSAFMLLVTVSVGWFAWNKRVRSPMARTRRTVKEDLEWSKERLV